MALTQHAGWALLGLALVGCGQDNGVPNNGAIQNRLALESFASCPDLEKYIEDTAVLQMRSRMQADRDQDYSYWRGNPEAADMNSTPTAAPAAGAAGPSNYTTTNTQVAGVDEADFVKNDGTRIFVLSGNRLHINQSWPANELKTLSSLEIEGWPTQMFLEGSNRLVVFSQVWNKGLYSPAIYGDNFAGDAMWCGYRYSNSLKITVVDISNTSAPVVGDTFYLPGSYSNSRRVGSSVRVVLNDEFRWPVKMQWYPEYQPGIYEDPSLRKAAYNQLIEENEKLIRAQTLADWLPTVKHKGADGVETDLGYACSDFHKSNAPTELGLLTVATLNLAKPDTLSRTSVVAQTGEIYASQKHLYVASPHWWWRPEPGQQDWTYLHKFDITDPDKAVYVASGGVAGHIVDQFSLDEATTGHFRVASTISTRTADPFSPWGQTQTANRVTVLEETAGRLVEVGKTEDLAPGERIFSARFFGNKGYLVTFRQVDPFFTLDLSDPKNPRKVGELKIPGFSTYLHPVDDNHVLAIGSYVPENGDWQQRAIKLSLFDVTNFAQPVEKYSQLVGTASAYSEAQYDHKAFNYFAAKKLLAIPFSDWNSNASGDSYWNAFVSDLRVFHVDPATGITPKGAVSLKDMYQSFNYYGWTYYWTPAVRRSVMADDFVYAISDSGIRVAEISSLGTPLKTVQFAPVKTE